MQCEEWADANSELFKEAHDETVHKNSYKRKLYELISASLGEEGHEVAKGCTRVRMIMIFDVDVTAERRHYNTHRPAGDTATLSAAGAVAP